MKILYQLKPLVKTAENIITMNHLFKKVYENQQLKILTLLFFLISYSLTAQDTDPRLQIDSSLNFIFLELLEESDPSEAYRYINIILDRRDYDINDFLNYCTYFTSDQDQQLKESLLLRLLDWFFEGNSEIQSVEKSLYNSASLDLIISRINHFKSSSLSILIIKLANFAQSKTNFRHIDAFITEKIKARKKNQLSDQDYYPLMLAFLELAQSTLEPIFLYNVESIYYDNRSNRLTSSAKKTLKAMLAK